jgi:hypothetical protein
MFFFEYRLCCRGGQNDDFRPLTSTLGGRGPLPWGGGDLYSGGEGYGVQGQICDILRPQLAMNRFLPLWPHKFPHFEYIHLGGAGGGALILDRCRAFDLFASVDAHLCSVVYDNCPSERRCGGRDGG